MRSFAYRNGSSRQRLAAIHLRITRSGNPTEARLKNPEAFIPRRSAPPPPGIKQSTSGSALKEASNNNSINNKNSNNSQYSIQQQQQASTYRYQQQQHSQRLPSSIPNSRSSPSGLPHHPQRNREMDYHHPLLLRLLPSHHPPLLSHKALLHFNAARLRPHPAAPRTV